MHGLIPSQEALGPECLLQVLFVGGELDDGHLLNINSQILHKPLNPLGLGRDQHLRKARKLDEAELILLHCHISLGQQLKL